MRRELEDRLSRQFSFMQRERAECGSSAYRQWGIECGDGWFELLWELCLSITERFEQDGRSAEELVVLQIKQKFSTLRFYFQFKDAPCPIQAFDSLGDGKSLRLYPDESDDAQTALLRRDIAQIVRSCEKRSAEVCESCGARGSRKNVSEHYVRTLCDDCFGDHLRKKEELKRSNR